MRQGKNRWQRKIMSKERKIKNLKIFNAQVAICFVLSEGQYKRVADWKLLVRILLIFHWNKAGIFENIQILISRFQVLGVVTSQQAHSYGGIGG